MSSDRLERFGRWVSAVLTLAVVALVAACVVAYLTNPPVFWLWSLWMWLAAVALLALQAVLRAPFARSWSGRLMPPAVCLVAVAGGFAYGAFIPAHAATTSRLPAAHARAVGGDQLTVRPSLKYELILSLHIIYDPDLHRSSQAGFVSAVQALPRDLAGDIATYLKMDEQRWEAALRDAPNSNEIDALLGYFRDNFHDYRWNAVLRRYWEGFFQSEYRRAHALLEESAQSAAAALEGTGDRALRDPFGHTEAMTGYAYTGPRRVILVPSRYAAPRTYGFEEKDGYAVIYDAALSTGWRQSFGTLYRAGLGPLSAHLRQDPRMVRLTEDLKRDADLTARWDGKSRGSGDWTAWVETNVAAALTAYLEAHAGLRQAAELQRALPTPYARQLFLSLMTQFQPGRVSTDEFLVQFTSGYLAGK